MSVIRTDYQTPYSQMGQTIGGGISAAGQAIGGAIARAPKEAREARIAALEEEKLLNDKDYRIKSIESAEKDFVDWAKQNRLTLDEYNSALEGFETAKKAPTEKAIKMVGDFSVNFSKWNEAKQLGSQDDIAGQLIEFTEKPNFSAMWSDENYDQKIDARMKSVMDGRKQGKINDFISEISKSDPSLPQEQIRILARQKAAEDPLLKKEPMEKVEEYIVKAYESRGDIEKRKMEGQKLGLEKDKAAREATGGAGGTDNTLKSIQDRKKDAGAKLVQIWGNVQAGLMKKETAEGLTQTFNKDAEIARMAESIALLGEEAGLTGPLDEKRSMGLAVKIAKDVKETSSDPDVIKMRAYIKNLSAEQGGPAGPAATVGRSGAAIPGTPTAQKESSPAATPPAAPDKFTVGKVYRNAKGEEAKYLGNGKWGKP